MDDCSFAPVLYSDSMVDASRVRTLTEQALDNFDNPGTSVAALVRQAQRIAVLRHDYGAQAWLALETNQYVPGSEIKKRDWLDLREKINNLLGVEDGEEEYYQQTRKYLINRSVGGGKMRDESVEQLELSLEQLTSTFDSLAVPDNLTQIDTYFYAERIENERIAFLPLLKNAKDIINRIKQSIYEYLLQVESELEQGKTESSFFEQVQVRINAALNKHSPEAAKRFIASQERVSAGGSEDISHALTSCRRMMESLADSLYPANNAVIKGGDGVERTMSEGAYKNRILQFVAESVGKHKDGKVLKAAVTEIASKLDALVSLSSKGVHDDATLAEAHTCVIQTYLLAGSLLAIADGTSYLMQDDENTASV